MSGNTSLHALRCRWLGLGNFCTVPGLSVAWYVIAGRTVGGGARCEPVWCAARWWGLRLPPRSAAALEFVQPAGSPYPTTNPPRTPGPGQYLGGVAVGDFNGDGISDVAVVNASGVPVPSRGESVTVLLGSRAGGLTIAPGSPVAIYSGGEFSGPGAIVTGDFTGVGKLDLAVVDEVHHSVAILLGNGAGQFQLAGSPIPFSGEGEASIAVGDFNGDGKLDLAVANTDLTVLLGDGSGAFTPAPESPPAVVHAL